MASRNRTAPSGAQRASIPPPPQMALAYVDLLRLFDTRQRTTLVRLLKAHGIRFMRDRRGRPITTVTELDRALRPTPDRAVTFTEPPSRRNKRTRCR